jgi:hypothetical protein
MDVWRSASRQNTELPAKHNIAIKVSDINLTKDMKLP